MWQINDISTISGIVRELNDIHNHERHERAIILFNCAYGLLVNAKEYEDDFDCHFKDETDKHAFRNATDTLLESFELESKRLNKAINREQE